MPEASKDENLPITIVLISGSLRARSVNGAVVSTAAKLVPAGARTVVYRRLVDLPHFNPDDDSDPLPESVAEMRELLLSADAALFSTPEYAGSLPGSFKNLLDWTVGGKLHLPPSRRLDKSVRARRLTGHLCGVADGPRPGRRRRHRGLQRHPRAEGRRR